jgi:hypothetical protein
MSVQTATRFSFDRFRSRLLLQISILLKSYWYEYQCYKVFIFTLKIKPYSADVLTNIKIDGTFTPTNNP